MLGWSERVSSGMEKIGHSSSAYRNPIRKQLGTILGREVVVKKPLGPIPSGFGKIRSYWNQLEPL